jgi:hypothetical protein
MGFWMARSRKHNVEAVVGALALLLTLSSAANAVMVTLVPSSATINTVGGTTVVNINTAQLSNVESFGFNLTYDPAVTSVPANGVVQGALTQGCNFVQVTNLPGRLTILTPCADVPVSGSGTLFSITFNGVANGSTNLSFSTLIVEGMVRIPNGCLLNEGSPTCEPVGGTLTVGSVAPTATASRTATRTNTGTPTRTSTFTATRTNTATPTRTRTSTNTPTGVFNTPTATRTALPATATASATSTVVATNTATRTATGTVTDTPTTGPSPTATNTALAPGTATATNTALAPGTATATLTPSTTLTPTNTVPVTDTATPASTATITATGTITNTPPPTSTRPGIPVIPSPLSAGGMLMIGGLGAALLWALNRLQRQP